MKNKLFYFIFMMFFFMGCAFAAKEQPSQNYLMWQLTQTEGFPVYVYSGNTQVGFIPSLESQAIIGAYNNQTQGNYQLYYQNNQQWYSCTVVLVAGNLDKSTTCPSASINPPATYGNAVSNVYALSLGSQAWPVSSAPPPTPPVSTSYDNRTITIYNNTQYSVIQIGAGYCTTSGSPCPAGDAVKVLNFQQIPQGQSYTVNVGQSGLNSAAFYVSGYCTSAAADCNKIANWVMTGGYGLGQQPYATKVEPTILPVQGGVPNGASNIDISAVDGFTIGAILYPASATYCTYTVPPEGSNLLGVGYYGPQSPLAALIPQNSTSLQALCQGSSQLPSGYSGSDKPWPLSIFSNNGTVFNGCMSPCTYATQTYGAQSTQAQQFCCTGPYHSVSSCLVPSGQVGANTSSYVTNILNDTTEFQNVYPFGYGDAGSDYACPPETNFIVRFVSSKPSATLSAPTNVTAVTGGATKASITVSWQGSTDNPASKNPSITYVATAVSNNGGATVVSQQSAANATQLDMSGLTPGATYTVTVTATDQSQNISPPSQPSAPVIIPNAAYSVSAPTNVKATVDSGNAATSATITWGASSDNPPDPNGEQMTYAVTATSLNGGGVVVSNSNNFPITKTTYDLTGLTPGATYTATVVATDSFGNVSPVSAPSNSFTLPSTVYTVSTPGDVVVTPLNSTAAQISTSGSNDIPTNINQFIIYTATAQPVPSSNNPATKPVYATSPFNQNTFQMTGLTPGGTYTLTMYATDSSQVNSPASSSTLPFTMPANITSYTVTPSTDGNESVSPDSPQTVDSGATQQFTVTANSGYTLGAVGGTCPQGSFNGNVYTTGAITSACSVNFTATQTAPTTYTVTPSGDNNETYTPSTPQSVDSGATEQFTVTANSGYTLGAVGGTCPAGSFNGDVYTTGAITSACSVNFTATQTAPATYTVTPSTDGNESVSPDSPQTVDSGATQQFTVTASQGYTLGAVGGTCPQGSFNGDVYTTGAITSACSVNFTATKTAPVPGTLTIPANGFREIRSSGVQGQLRWLVQASGFTPSQMSCSFVIAANGATAPCTCGNVGGGTWRCETSVFRPPSVPGRYTVTVGNTAPGAPPVSAPYQMSR